MAVEISEKKLNGAGLATLWGRIKTLVSNSIDNLSSVYAAMSHTHTKSEITDLTNATDSAGGLMTDAQAVKLAGIEVGAEVNVVKGIQKNGIDVQPDATSKKVNLAIPTKTSDLDNDDNVVKDAKYVHTDSNYTSDEKMKLGNVAAGAQVNVIETIQVNGSNLVPSEKIVSIIIPTDNASLANGAGYQTAAQVESAINAKISSAYKAGGSKAPAELTSALLVAANEGKVFNITASFSPDNNFVEGTDTKQYPAGTNVAVINIGAEDNPLFRFDVQAGLYDFSEFATNDDVESLTSDEVAAICTYLE